MNEALGAERSRRQDTSMTASRMDNEEVTVSQLLQSLRNEAEKSERLQGELQACTARYEGKRFSAVKVLKMFLF